MFYDITQGIFYINGYSSASELEQRLLSGLVFEKFSFPFSARKSEILTDNLRGFPQPHNSIAWTEL
jgi:hypothetical protein